MQVSPVTEANLIDAIGTIYEAGLEHNRWGKVLETVVEAVGGQSGILGMSDIATTQALDLNTYRLDPDLMNRWKEEFDREDPWIDHGAALAEGDVFQGFQLISHSELRRKRVYREIMEPLGCRDVLGSIVAKNRWRLGWVNAYDAEREDGFSTESIDRMVILTPHLHRAARIHGKFSELYAQEHVASATLNSLNFGILACDQTGLLLSANRVAEKLLSDGDAICLESGRLTAKGRPEADRLRVLLARSAKIAEGRSAEGGGALVLSQGKFRNAFTAFVVPLSKRREHGTRFGPGPTAVSLILIVAPDADITAPSGLLHELYGLTNAETRVAMTIVNGGTVEGYAEKFNIKRDTARGHLKRVLSKTQTGKQARLAALLMRLLAPLSN